MDLKEEFPGSSEALHALSEVIAVYRREALRDPMGLELEVRFGTATGDFLTTGVSADFVNRTMTLMQTNPSLTFSDWFELQDFFFDHRGVEQRSRSRYDTEELRVHSEVITKTRLAECQLRCKGTALRVVASREAVVGHGDADVVEPKHVRIQQRKTASFCSTGFGPGPTWVVDFGMVWSGDTKLDAERKQMNAEAPQYSLELELTDPRYALRNDDAFVACSLALKASDFLEPGAFFDLVPAGGASGPRGGSKLFLHP